jgi:hypothetical protein
VVRPKAEAVGGSSYYSSSGFDSASAVDGEIDAGRLAANSAMTRARAYVECVDPYRRMLRRNVHAFFPIKPLLCGAACRANCSAISSPSLTAPLAATFFSASHW